ncbi:MAG: HDOD domain-containing protein [Phycisphaerales bacterium]
MVHGTQSETGSRPSAAAAERILGRLDALPTLSPVATRLMRVASAEDADLDEIVSLIETDPALTARVLGLCRRAELGLGDKITTVRRAVTMLGLDIVQSAVLAVHVYELLSEQGAELDRVRAERGQAPSTFDRAGLWRHSIAVACASELLASKAPALGVKGDQAFVAGLLHDIGRLALELALPEAYAKVVRLGERRACDCAPVEREVLGLDHHTAGRHIARRWGLPTPIEHVAWLHAQPIASLPQTPARSLVGLVTLARALCRRQHLGWSGDFGPNPEIGPIASALGISPGVVESVVPRLLESVATRCATLGLGEPTPPELLLESLALANDRLCALNETLSRRARQAQRQAGLLDAIVRFAAAPDDSVGVALSRIAASAERAFGAGFYASVSQSGAGRAWQITQYAPGGRPTREHTADAPPGRDGAGLLAALADASGPSIASAGAIEWLTDYLAGATDLRRVRVLPLCAHGRPVGDPARRADASDGVTALLLHEPDPTRDGFAPEELRALIGVWSSALLAAASREASGALSDKLVETNRALGEAQATLTARESLTRLGEMSAGAAHEMNNPLTIIRGRSQLLADRLQDPREKAAARAIAEASGRLAQLITAMHALASPPRPKLERHDAMQLVDEAIEVAKKRTGTNASVRVTTQTIVAPVVADREQLVAALAELISNAIEAAPGEIVELRVQTDPDDGRFVCRVVDRGPGLSDRAARHAFDPFFSEKAAGRQTGLGLARARRFAELHAGDVSLAKAPGRGTIATLSIPSGLGRQPTQDQGGRMAA